METCPSPDAFEADDGEITEGTPLDQEASVKNTIEGYGRNVEMVIYLIRHAERPLHQTEPHVELTENGIDQCEDFGKNLNNRRIGAEHSPTVRTKDTANLIVGGSPALLKERIKERKELASHYSKEYAEKIRGHVRHIYEENGWEIPENRELCSTVEGIDYYLKETGRPDPETYSPIETAANVALRVQAAIERVDHLESGTAMDYLMVTHDFVIAAFLQQILTKEEHGQTKKGFESLAELGDDPIDFLEHARITVKIDENGKKTIGIEFRNESFKMDTDKFGELVEIGKALEESENQNQPRTKNQIPDEEFLQAELKRMGIEN